MKYCIPCCPLAPDGECQIVFITGQGVDVGHCTLPGSAGDEIHSCCVAGSTLVVPGLISGRVYLVDMAGDMTALASQPSVTVLTPSRLTQPFECIAAPSSSAVYVSCKGGLLVVNGDDKSLTEHLAPQLSWAGGITVSPDGRFVAQTTWADTESWRVGYNARDVARGRYGSKVCVWDAAVLQAPPTDPPAATPTLTVDLGPEGVAPLAVCLLDSSRPAGYVACCPASNVFYIHEDRGRLVHTKCIDIPQRVGAKGRTQAMTVGIACTADNRFLFVATWMTGVIRQYDISAPQFPILVGQLVAPADAAGFTPGGLTLTASALLVSTGFFRAWRTQLLDESTADAPCGLYQCIPNTTQGGLTLDPLFRYSIPGYGCMRPTVLE